MSHLPKDYLTVLPRLPTDEQIQRSELLKCDSFFKLPKEVECFVSRANQELPTGWQVKPWTINRAVTLFHNGESVRVIDYMVIEDGHLVKILDLVNSLAVSFKNGERNEQ